MLYNVVFMKIHHDKKLFVFDLDKTLAESKQLMDDEMTTLLRTLLGRFLVSVISGGSFTQFQKQFLPKLGPGKYLENLYLFPTCGGAFYRYQQGEWKEVYTEMLDSEDKKRIFTAFSKMFEEVGFKMPDTLYGELIEDRLTQITFSAFGSAAPLHIKKSWDMDRSKRLRMIKALARHIPEFEIRTGGTSSIDVTKKGIDKAYGILQMEKHIGVTQAEMLFVGDDLGLGGNDYPVKALGVSCIEVNGPIETKEIIKDIIALHSVKE